LVACRLWDRFPNTHCSIGLPGIKALLNEVIEKLPADFVNAIFAYLDRDHDAVLNRLPGTL
jgi:hypothetical protein